MLKNKIKTIEITKPKEIEKIKTIITQDNKNKMVIVEYKDNTLKINNKKIAETNTDNAKYTGVINYEINKINIDLYKYEAPTPKQYAWVKDTCMKKNLFMPPYIKQAYTEFLSEWGDKNNTKQTIGLPD